MIPRVSIITPTFNRKDLVRKSIESVLTQTFKNWELLIIDNGSSDGTYDMLCREYSADTRIRTFQEKKKGCHNARNLALKNIRGDYVAFLDDDDQYLPDTLEKQVTYLERHPKVSLVYGYVAFVNEKGEEVMVLPRKPATNFIELAEVSCLFPSTAVARRECIQATGYFRDDLSTCTDFDFMLRIAHRFLIAFNPQIMSRYIRHDTNLTRDRVRLFMNESRVRRDLNRLNLSNHEQQQIETFIFKDARQMHHLAAEKMAAHEYREAVRIYGAVLRIVPAIGLKMNWGRFNNSAYRFLRPYLAAVYCWFRSFLPAKAKVGCANA